MRSDFVEAARSYLGTRYRHCGRSRDHGVDCIGLLICAANDCGLEDNFDFRDYMARPEGHRLFRELSKKLEKIPLGYMQPGDIVAFSGPERLPCHLAIVTETGPVQIIHAWSEHRVVVEHRMARSRLGAPVGCFRHPRLKDG